MSAGSRLRVAGADHRSPGRVTLFPSADRLSPACLVMTPGLKKSVNEDAGGWDRTERRGLYAVADAHFGGESAVLAVDQTLSRLSSRLGRKDHFEPARFRAAFADALVETEARIRRELGAEGSETTLLVVASGWGRWFYGSFGDSRLYLAGAGGPRQINRTSSAYLCGASRNAASLGREMVCGELRGLGATPAEAADPSAPPTRLMLCTDGVPLCAGARGEEWSPVAIGGVLLSGPDVSGAGSSLAAAALRRGGADNICAIVLDV